MDSENGTMFSATLKVKNTDTSQTQVTRSSNLTGKALNQLTDCYNNQINTNLNKKQENSKDLHLGKDRKPAEDIESFRKMENYFESQNSFKDKSLDKQNNFGQNLKNKNLKSSDILILQNYKKANQILFNLKEKNQNIDYFSISNMIHRENNFAEKQRNTPNQNKNQSHDYCKINSNTEESLPTQGNENFDYQMPKMTRSQILRKEAIQNHEKKQRSLSFIIASNKDQSPQINLENQSQNGQFKLAQKQSIENLQNSQITSTPYNDKFHQNPEEDQKNHSENTPTRVRQNSANIRDKENSFLNSELTYDNTIQNNFQNTSQTDNFPNFGLLATKDNFNDVNINDQNKFVQHKETLKRPNLDQSPTQNCNQSPDQIKNNKKIENKTINNSTNNCFSFQIGINSSSALEITSNNLIDSGAHNRSSISNTNMYTVGSISDWARNKFPVLIKLLTMSDQGLRPTRWLRNHLDRVIEEIYSAQFQKNTQIIRAGGNNQRATKDSLDDMCPSVSLSVFIQNWYLEKYKISKMAEQQIIHLLASLEYHLTLENSNKKESVLSSSDLNLNLFVKFLSQEYTSDELTYFLFVRSIVEKNQSIEFPNIIAYKSITPHNSLTSANQTTENSNNYNQVPRKLEIQTCFEIAMRIFGEKQEILIHNFMMVIEDHMSQNLSGLQSLCKIQQSTLDVYELLKIAIEEYRQQKQSINIVKNWNETNQIHFIKEQRQSFHSENFSEQEEEQKHTVNQNMIDHHQKRLSKGIEKNLFEFNQETESIQNLSKNPINYQKNLQFRDSLKDSDGDENQLQSDSNNQNKSKQQFYEDVTLFTPIQIKTKEDQLKYIDYQRGLESQQSLPLSNRSGPSEDQYLYEDPKESDVIYTSDKILSELELVVFEKMKKKIKQFLIIMLGDEEQQASDGKTIIKPFQSIQSAEEETQNRLEQKQRTFNYLMKIIIQKVSALLNSIFQCNKIEWFRILLIDEPNGQQIEFVQNLQKEYRAILQMYSVSNLVQSQEISNFCQQILQTPNLSEAVSQLLILCSINDYQ